MYSESEMAPGADGRQEGRPRTLLPVQGLTPLQSQLLPMVPLVQMAWLEGGVTGRERQRVFDLAAYRGIRPGTAAWALLDDWLTERPPSDLMGQTMAVLRKALVRMSDDERATFVEHLLVFAEGVARASGWPNRRGAVSLAERALLDRLATAFTPSPA